MAGFMSGFGAAFSRSFENSRDRAAQKEDDMFKIKFSEYVRRREKEETKVDEDRKRVQLAKGLVEGKAPEAWSKVYDWLRSGMPLDTVQDRIQNGAFKVEAGVPTQPTAPMGAGATEQNDSDLASNAQSAVNQDMEANGMIPPEDGGVFKKEDKSLDLFGIDRGNTDSRVDSRIAEAAGTTPEDIQRIFENKPEMEQLPGVEGKVVSWTPGAGEDPAWEVNSLEDAATNLNRARATNDPVQIQNATDVWNSQLAVRALETESALRMKGEWFQPTMAAIKRDGEFVGWAQNKGTSQGEPIWVDDQGNQVNPLEVTPMDRSMMEWTKEIIKNTKEPAAEYMIGVENLASTSRAYAELNDIVTKNPGATLYIGTAAKFVDAAINNIHAGMNLIAQSAIQSEDFNAGGLNDMIRQEKSIENAYKNFQGSAVEKLALAATLADAKATRIAYAYGVSLGQQGRSVTQEEFNNFKRNVIADGNPEAMRQGASDWISNEYIRLNGMAENINKNHPDIRAFEQFNNMPVPFKPAAPIDSIIGVNPDNLKIVKDFKSAAFAHSNQTDPMASHPTDPAMQVPPEAQGQEVFEGYTPDGREVWTKPDGTKVVR